jgi:hypothetical protein
MPHLPPKGSTLHVHSTRQHSAENPNSSAACSRMHVSVQPTSSKDLEKLEMHSRQHEIISACPTSLQKAQLCMYSLKKHQCPRNLPTPPQVPVLVDTYLPMPTHGKHRSHCHTPSHLPAHAKPTRAGLHEPTIEDTRPHMPNLAGSYTPLHPICSRHTCPSSATPRSKCKHLPTLENTCTNLPTTA